MNKHDQLIAQSKQTIAALRSTTAQAQQLIDDLSHTLNHLECSAHAATAGTTFPGTPSTTERGGGGGVGGARPAVSASPPALHSPRPVPNPTPNPAPNPGAFPVAATVRASGASTTTPPKPPLTTEQKVIRIAAVLGSLITFVGACFGVALAIQSGLLGPGGRAAGAFIFALVLLGAGLTTDIRRGPSPGVTALYVTSILVLLADLFYVARVQDWISLATMTVVFLIVWAAYLGLAFWRENLWLVLWMCVALVPYSALLLGEEAFSAIFVMLAPLMVLVCTWFIPTERTPKLTVVVRLFAGALLTQQLLTAAIISTFVDGVPIGAVIGYLGVVLFIIGERFFPAARAGSASRTLLSVVVPAVVVVASYGLVGGTSLWIPLAVSIVATVIAGLLWLGERSPDGQEMSSLCFTGWLMFTPFLFVPLVWQASGETPPNAYGETLPVLLYLVGFAAVLFVIRFRPVHIVPALAAWSIALVLVTAHLGISTASTLYARPTAVHDLVTGIALAAFLAFAVSQLTLWRRLPSIGRGLFAGAGLILGMIAVVTVTTAVAALISPDCVGQSWPVPTDTPITSCGEAEGYQVGFRVGHMIVSISWMALASWLLLKRPPNGTDGKARRISGLVLALVATAKLVMFDMASLSGIPRVITFVVCGLLLIAVAILGSQRNVNANENEWTTYPAGSRRGTGR